MLAASTLWSCEPICHIFVPRALSWSCLKSLNSFYAAGSHRVTLISCISSRLYPLTFTLAAFTLWFKSMTNKLSYFCRKESFHGLDQLSCLLSLISRLSLPLCHSSSNFSTASTSQLSILSFWHSLQVPLITSHHAFLLEQHQNQSAQWHTQQCPEH